ncbi:hypothetical protein IVB41_07255 [Bradyrhizobium sp. 44]|uniref:hypothetical protein n=1 Tax=Bradyrhizobium sp. 44 TaxID=2782675 RepID=UPI001FF7BCDA|nr:hypothetical protein [Bradyrhizobium sp. 44]MCK1283736.1 hypothetical protein [Bradyrhizobium sp. 44]
MAGKKQGYKLTVAGPGHSFEREIDEAIASQIISLVITGKVSHAADARHSGGGSPGSGAGAHAPAHAAPARVGGSLASHIKAKKGDKNQNNRFLATAHWLSGRDDSPLTAKAVAGALSDHNQKRLANPPDALNQNVRKGYCEKRKDGSFFITPEGLEALEGTPPE